MDQLYTQLFRGHVSVGAYPSWGLEEIFNRQNVNAEPESSEISIPNPTRIGLPELDGVTSTSAINITGEAVDFSPRAAGIALYGSVERVPSGSEEDEPHDAYVGGDIVLQHLPLAVTAVTSDDGVTVYTRGTDYAVLPGGIRVLPGGALAADINAETAGVDGRKKLPILVSYSYPTVDLIKPFTQGRKFYRVMFAQVNEGGANEKRRIKCFYARISLNGGMPITQGAEFGSIPVSIRLLPDPNVYEPGDAAFFTIEHEAVDA